ncbi:MAG TPA: putative glycoside hydrolase [Acidimicrobiia bacterium]|nr:putative glycoside hydrolase [Acidimicrobiia bacterium]
MRSYDAMSVFDRRSRRVSRRLRKTTPLASARPPVVADNPRKFRRKRHWGRIILRTLIVAAVLGGTIGGFVLLRAITAADQIRIQVLGAEGRPLEGAVVTTESGKSYNTVEGGLVRVPFDLPEVLTVSARGYVSATYTVEQLPLQGALGLQMEPLVLQGRVTDANGIGVVGAMVTINDMTTTTQEFGSFELVEAMPGTVVVEKAAWETATAEWSGERRRLDVRMDAFTVRGLRVEPKTAGDDELFAQILEFADASTVNALVFDTKIELGNVVHDIEGYDEPQAIGALQPVYDVRQRLAQAKEHGLYTITRIVTFQDPYASLHRNDYAIHNTIDGDTWTTWSGLGWMDPTDRGSWEYPIELGVAACKMGFDEIQFDYVRFPSDGDINTAVYDHPEALDGAGRVATIGEFLSTARQRINEAGCAVSADLFAIVLSVRDDQGIGQKVEELSWTVDAISPMVYPSHYGPGWLNLDEPNDHPAAVVGEALESGMIRMEGGALLRPWLQGFSWSASQVREAIATAEDLNMGWLLWNQLSYYEMEWLPPDNTE